MFFSFPSLCVLCFCLHSGLPLLLTWDERTVRLQTYGITEVTILANATLYFSTRMQSLPSAEEGGGLAQLIYRRMVLLDNFSCSGLMASTPGKPRSCTGPILFIRTGGFFLKTLMEVAKKNQKFQIQPVWVSDYPFWVNIKGYFPLVSSSTLFLNTIQAHLATGRLLLFISHP